MTERPPALRHPHLVDVAQWQPVDGPPAKKEAAVGCSDATHGTCGTSSSAPEGC